MNKTTSMNCALALIAVALAGAGISYHLTLESRFAALEQKMDQSSVAFQQYQISQETLVASKMDTINSLNKQVEDLQASLAPLGRATHEQTDALADLHKQIATLQQSQQVQEDAQKKLSDYAGQIDKIKHDIAQVPVSVPMPTTTSATVATTSVAPAVTVVPVVATPAPVVTPPPQVTLVASRAPVASIVPLPVPLRAESAVDIRPDQATAIADDASVRALPVALPVADVR